MLKRGQGDGFFAEFVGEGRGLGDSFFAESFNFVCVCVCVWGCVCVSVSRKGCTFAQHDDLFEHVMF